MSNIASYLIQKTVFPILFTLCVICRPAVLSIPYLLFLFYAPFLPAGTNKTIHGRSRYFFKCVAFVTIIIVTLQIWSQIALYAKQLESLSSMGTWGKFLQNIGVTELYKSESQMFCWCFLLDMIICGLSFMTLVVFNRNTVVDRDSDIEESIVLDSIIIRSNHLQMNIRAILEGIAIFCVLSTVLIAATLQPSIPSAIYFLVFLFITTTWAMNKKMYNTLIGSIWFLCSVMIIHMSIMFAFQTTWLQSHINHNSTILRYFGLRTLIVSNVDSEQNKLLPKLTVVHADVLLNPIAILLCYYASAIYLRDIAGKHIEKTHSGAIPLQPMNDERHSTQIGDLRTFVRRLYCFVCRHCNIVSNLMMMIWSIIFRSWLSIVFLLVVSVLWTRPIERKSAHRINLFIVLYADLLLILQYFYDVIFTGNEPPVRDSAIVTNLSQIGIVRYDSLPCIPLLFKAICTVTFCFTLRQKKIDEERKRMSYSFQINSDEGKTIWKCFDFGINILTHIWVVMILLTMFIYAIYGKEVNLLKLCYMIYVLIFITSYQISLHFWKRILYTLWMLVIISSMANMIIIYTYQFDDFDYLWQNYLGVDKQMQTIIGLHQHGTKELLIQLFYFTFLVVITAIQLLIFHKKYTKQFIMKPTENGSNFMQQDVTDEPNTTENPIADKTILERVVQGVSSFIDVNRKLFDCACSFLEMQFFKVVLILGFLMGVSEISAFNMLIIVLVVIACCFEESASHLSSGFITLFAGVIITSKMLYQLLKIPESLLNLLCIVDESKSLSFTSMTFCDVNNTAKWLGVYRPNNDHNLIQFLGVYLIFITATTMFSTVSYYQRRKRFKKGEPLQRPQVLFDGVTREDADKNVVLLVKYLFNYGFYKFGIEITLIAMAILICFRRDTLSIVYIIWLCVIFSVQRSSKQFIWPVLQYFVAITILMQYAIVLNLPSFLQSSFDWEFAFIECVEGFISLKNAPDKLFMDFIVLMCVCRQRIVFGIEKKYGGKKYPGGRNESSVEDIGIIISGQLPIRTHDFLYPTNWLDILKSVVYFSSFWVTLSIVLLTGTNNVSAFSLGYLISSFLFCYIGTNFYMKQIHSILRWWNLLIAFNIFVIIIKSILNLRLVIGGVFSTHETLTSIHTFLSEKKQSTKPLDMCYDCLCFAFLIFQLRIFKSIDFCHIINESRATFVCDSRGTKLLADRMHEMHSIQMQREKETIENIKLKVERIKANQQKFEPNLIPAKTHHEAVRYNGRYLYEDLVDKGEFDPRQNESKIGTEESFLLKNQNRIDSTTKEFNSTIRNETYNVENESEIRDDGVDRESTDDTQKNYLVLALRDFVISITLYLYKFSRNYRFVHEILSKEKKLLKLKSCGSEDPGEERVYFFAHQHSILSEFFQALWFALIANTDVLCYLFIFLNTIISMSMLTLPMSLCVCLWATLTTPRPSKRFWLTIIAYTEFLVFVQYFLQIISHFHKIDITKLNATYNLILLHFVLFHRSVLKHMGIWTFTKRNNKDAVHALELLRTRSVNSDMECEPIVQIPADVYTLMFLCDLINFFVLMFGFSAFSQSPADGGVQNYLNEDQVPFRFLLTLLVQFVSLIIDRALYLRRNMNGKIIFHIISVVAVHMWQFRFMRLFDERPSHAITWPPMLFYFIKCIYFLLSAYQIRCGYPKRVSGNFTNNGSSIMHCYQMIPFLSEARTLLDWICIKTSLSLYEWFKMEDIYSAMFTIKCHRQYEKTVPRPRGIVNGSKSDYVRACVSLVAFFVLIWGPWALFTFDHTVGKPNIPYEVSVSLHAGSMEPIYRMTAQMSEIHQFTEMDLISMKSIYVNNTAMQSFISNYDEEDIAAISLNVNSTSLWTISPPSLQKFIDDLDQNETIKFRYSLSVSRFTHEQPSDTVEANQLFYLSEDDLARQELLNILNQKNRTQSVQLSFLFPKFIKVMNSKGLQPVPQFQVENADSSLRNITIHLHEVENMQWWEVAENCNDTFYQEVLSKLPYADCEQYSVFYTFNDKLFPSSLSPFIGGGIIGLYSTYILLTSKFFRQFLASKISDIIREDLPYVDRILQLCSDIYLAREQGDYKLEEDLYAKLIFLYRSPETMIRWTRMPEVETPVDCIGDIDESDAEKALRRSLNHRLL